MNKMYTESILLRSTGCDLFGAWRPGAILSSMQETAGIHVAQLGLDPHAMQKMNLAWVLTRTKVEFSRLPAENEPLTITTYPTPNRHLFYPRSHVFCDASGAQIGCAASLWVTMNLSTRRIEKSDEVLRCMPDNSDLAPAAMPATVRPLDAEATLGTIAPRLTDLDQNMHVNNTKYLDWCFDALGLDALRERAIAAFDVNYDAEILYGCEIHTQLALKDDRFSFIGCDDQGKRRFAIQGQLRPRR